MTYLLGILVTLTSELFLGIANIFDSHLSRKTFSSVWSLVTINGLLLIPILPIFYLLLTPEMLSSQQFMMLFAIAFLEFIYQIPYYKALREAETSTVILLFNLEKMFVPVIAYFIIGEHLTTMQYVGFFIIVMSSILVTYKGRSQGFSKAIYYMLLVSLILSFSSVFQKFGLNQIEWKTFYFWHLTLSIPFYLSAIFGLASVRREVLSFVKSPFERKYIPLYCQNLSTWLGGGFATLGLSILPVTITKLIESFPGLLVHIIASSRTEVFTIDVKETLSLKRVCLFLFVGIGVFLTLFYR